MRVIAGSARSLPLKTPAGNETRPTADRIKETLFNILMPEIPGAIFMDLFSGSGGIGIEALSRGAKKAYFIEKSAPACQCIKENLKFTKFEEQSVLFRKDVFFALRGIREKEVNIIFADPPYQDGCYEKLLAILSKIDYVTDNTWIILEADLKTDFSFSEEYGFCIRKEKKYKTNRHLFMQRKGEV